MDTRRAPYTLDFVVVGGGIGGLAVAYALSRAGHRVRLLEKRGLSGPTGSVRVPPNLSKILGRWFGKEALAKASIRCMGSTFLRLQTGEKVGYMEWKDAIMAETGGDFLLMLREELLQMLHQLAVDAGARVDLHTTVVSVQPGAPKPIVTLETGEEIMADIVVGADGVDSIVREVVLEGQDPCVVPGGLTAYFAHVDAVDVLKVPELAPMVYADDWPIWMGDSVLLGGSPTPHRDQFIMAWFEWHRSRDILQERQKSWEVLVSPDAIMMGQQAPALQRLVKMAPHYLRAEYVTCSDEDHGWVDQSGRIVLLGDAAHPSLPGGTHTASMAVEDAVVLGALFSRLGSPGQIPCLLSAYQELRQSRTKSVCLSDRGNGEMMAWPSGPAADARDAAMARTVTEWDEGTMRATFEQLAEIFLYDARDAAEEWWIDWGRWKFPETPTSSDEAQRWLPVVADRYVEVEQLSAVL